MPIPLSNQQRQVQAPRVARGFVDPDAAARSINEAFKPAMNAIQNMQSGVNSALKMAKANMQAEEQTKANDALTKYFSIREENDTQMQQLKGADAIAYRDKYYQDAEKSYYEALNAIDSLTDATVREDARRQLNRYNMSSAQRSSMYFYEQQEKYYNDALDAKLVNDKNITLNNFTGNALQDLKSLEEAIIQGQADITARYATQGVAPEVITQKLREYSTDMATQAVDTAVRQAILHNNQDPYAVGLQMLYNIPEQFLSEQDRINVARGYEKERLGLLAYRNPNLLVSPDRQLNESFLMQAAPNLTWLERWQAAETALNTINAAKNSSAGGLSTADLQALATWDEENKNNYRNWKRNFGFMTQSEINDYTVGLSKSDKDEFLEDINERRANMKISDAAMQYATILNLMHSPIAVNQYGQYYQGQIQTQNGTIPVSEQERLAQMGYHIVDVPLNQRDPAFWNNTLSELRTLINERIDSDDADYLSPGGLIESDPSVLDAMLGTFLQTERGSRYQGLFQGTLPADRQSIASVILDFTQEAMRNGWDKVKMNSLNQGKERQAVADAMTRAISNSSPAFKTTYLSPANSLVQNAARMGQETNPGDALINAFYAKSRSRAFIDRLRDENVLFGFPNMLPIQDMLHPERSGTNVINRLNPIRNMLRNKINAEENR